MTDREVAAKLFGFLVKVVLAAGVALLLLSGCATTRVTSAGWTTGNYPLLTVVVTVNRAEARRHCYEAVAVGGLFGGPRGADNMAGCKQERVAPDGWRIFKVVRTVEALPSERDLMFEAHEYCHVLESLLGHKTAPCHKYGEHDLAVALLARRTRRRRRGEDDDEVWKPIGGEPVKGGR